MPDLARNSRSHTILDLVQITCALITYTNLARISCARTDSASAIPHLARIIEAFPHLLEFLLP